MEHGSKYQYILRFCLPPGHHEEERLGALLSFCQEASIDDVMFFVDCEELNVGHIPQEEAKAWVDLIARGKELLAPLGITTSINPWTTLGHADRGRTFGPGQNFQPLVDRRGRQSSACACPLDPQWRDYICRMYGFYASVEPNMLWIEDDFRFHNHAPLEWGGCFCDLHMREFSRRAGGTLSREAFVDGLLQPGTPHPYRTLWLDLARETMSSLAGEIGRAVHRVSPKTRVALMSSIPSVHCAEGRDWSGILEGLAGGTALVNRPHLPSYQELGPQAYFWSFNTISVLSRAMVPQATEIYPELENSPRTLFAKSRSFTKFQIDTSLVLGSRGITMNLFNVMGSGVLAQEGFGAMLAEAKPFLERINGLGIPYGRPRGVRVLYHPGSSYTLETTTGRQMEELYPTENFWAGLLSCFGIANYYSQDDGVEGQIVAVSGQYFRNLTRPRIAALLENNFVLLEGEAVRTLHEMGCGDLLGLRGLQWYPPFSGGHAYEEVCDGERYCGIEEARMSLQRAEGGYYRIDYASDPRLITVAKNSRGELAGPGMALVRGRTFVLPCGGKDSFFQIHLDTYKQAILQTLVGGLEGYERPPYAEGVPYLGVYAFEDAEQCAILAVNASGDPLEGVRLHLPEGAFLGAREHRRSGEEPLRIEEGPRGRWVVGDFERGELKAIVLKKARP